jgi:nitrite reductase/ring-hydroxylating ferredoxin subunit
MLSDREFSVCRERDVPLRFGKRVEIDDEEIVLMRHKGNIIAFENSCPHQRTNRLHEGMILEDEIECPLHGWRFNVFDGSMVARTVRLRVYACRVEGDMVIVTIPERGFAF